MRSITLNSKIRENCKQLPPELCRIIMLYSTAPALEILFSDDEKFSAANLYASIQEGERKVEIVRMMEELFDRQCDENEELISSVRVAIVDDPAGKKEMVMNLLQQLLDAQCPWKQPARLFLFSKISNELTFHYDRESSNKIIFHFCKTMGKAIYDDLGLEALDISLFN